MMALLAALDTRGGHILILLVLIFTGAAFTKLGLSKGEDILVGAFSGLLVAMRGKGGPQGDGDVGPVAPPSAPPPPL